MTVFHTLFRIAAVAAAVSWIIIPTDGSASIRSAAAAPFPASTERDKPLVTFSLLSDIHVQENDEMSQQLFVKALKDHYSIKSDNHMLLINGDLTNGAGEDFDMLRQLLNSTPHAPVHATMGNHEYYGMWRHGSHYNYAKLSKQWSSVKATAQFMDFFGYSKAYHETTLQGVPFLFMSGEAYRDVDASFAEDAYLSEEQLVWLDTRLAEHQARRNAKPGGGTAARGTDLPALVFLHQPLPGTLDGSSLERGVVQHERLRAILEKYPFVVLFSGHTHWDWETTNQLWRGPFVAVGSASVRIVYGPDNKPLHPAKSESLFVEVYDGRIVVRAIDHEDGRWIGDPAVIHWGGGGAGSRMPSQ
ncbi:serine/threonine protein phosphatase [Paenibacillus mesophilus]|uniref:metallophosphoesterase family protein n=1 Tax=Paenibacillus mesophilus TaxID=2582849 RepID=UPI00110E8DD4|nr:metallophosphoesterase [Paenibacillus mesophilus]TMV45108.1 serine/threonine protein phosphatase [Paenibacillus mesophilus]